MTMRSRYLRAAGAVWGAVVVAALSAATAAAQAPAFGTTAVDRKFTKKTEFQLPITINPADQAGLREVVLFVKTPTTNWQKHTSVPPSQSGFTFRAPQDGEYWFSVVTIDRSGAATPPDVSREPPAVVVVVDTQPPNFNLITWTAPTNEICLRCVVQDANPDYQGIKITYQAGDQTWVTLDPHPSQAGAFRVPNPNLLSGTVRVVARDLAGNVTQRDVSVRDTLAAAAPRSVVPPAPAAPVNPPAVQQASQPQGNTAPQAVQQGNAAPQGNSGLQQANVVPPQGNTGVQQVSVPPQTFPQVTPPAPALAEVKTQKVAVPNFATTTAQNGVPRLIINTLHASVDYRIDQVGPSGVGKVDIWLTSDSGGNWKKWCEDHDRRSPAEIDLPGEGLFGLRLVVTNGNGFGGKTPNRGDTPTNWIEVDMTPPAVQLRDIEPITNGSTIDIRWHASDKNLTPEPIQLYYATRKEGPWTQVARNVKNDGLYAWAFPRDQGDHFFIRVEAVDMAGNVGRCESAAPIQLDMTEPQAQVITITGGNSAPAPTQPQGH
jgi:hypothetical protein